MPKRTTDSTRQLVILVRLIRHGLPVSDLQVALDLLAAGYWTDDGFLLRADNLESGQQDLILRLVEIGMFHGTDCPRGETGTWVSVILPRKRGPVRKPRAIYATVGEIVKKVSGTDWTPRKVVWTTVNGRPQAGSSDLSRLYQFDRQQEARGISLEAQRAYLEYAVNLWYNRCRGNLNKLVGYIVSPEVYGNYQAELRKSGTRAGFKPGYAGDRQKDWDARRSQNPVS